MPIPKPIPKFLSKPRIYRKRGWWICRGFMEEAIAKGWAKSPKAAYNACVRNAQWILMKYPGRYKK